MALSVRTLAVLSPFFSGADRIPPSPFLLLPDL